MTQTWFITGASSGFGAAFARHAFDQGHNVVVTARRLDKLEQIAAIDSDRVMAHQTDFTGPANITEAVAAAEDRFGCIDLLINIAATVFWSGRGRTSCRTRPTSIWVLNASLRFRFQQA